MNEERMHILKMLQEGKINVDEATKLIEALDNKPTEQISSFVPITNEMQSARNVAQLDQPRLSFRWSMLNFLFSNLNGTIIDGGDYEGALILCSNLDSANLRTGNFQQTWVLCANLDSANFEGANLQGAKIFASNLDHADFRGADLRDATILCANLEGADFRGADLRGKTFIGVSLAGHKAPKAAPQVVVEA
ncbi:hypothetical protein BH10CHL1_BH10CHL1_19750 [soil metagenome]